MDQELGFGVGVDASGSAYVTGMTLSGDFPIADAFQPTFGGSPLYSSSDGISNWTPIEEGLRTREVCSLAVDRARPGTLYAGTRGDGLFKSTNYGTTWSSMNTGLASPYVYAIAIDPTSSSIYVGTGSGAFRSIDGGENWEGIGFAGSLVAAVLAVGSYPGAVYVAIGNPSDVFTSTDGGQTWSATNLHDSIATLAGDPVSPEVIYAGGTNGACTSYGGGTGWNHVSIEDVHALVVDPTTNPAVVYAGAFQGVFKSVDQGGSWNPTSLSGARVEALGILWATTAGGGSALFAGLEQGMFVSGDQGMTWALAGLNAPAVRVIASGPAPSPVYAGTYTAADAFVTKLNPAGSAIVYSTLLGGAGWEAAHGIAIGQDGSAYVTGTTDSNDFPTTAGSFQGRHQGRLDVFLTVLDPTGGRFVYSTYFGGSGQDSDPAVAVDGAGTTYLTGTTYSNDLPVLGALQPLPAAGGDAFVAAFNDSGSLVFSTYLGGSGSDGGHAIATGSDGAVYVAGYTSSTDFPTRNPGPASLSGAGGGFVAALVRGDSDIVDRIPPLLNVEGPHEGTYLHSAPVPINFTATDAVSGPVPGTATLDGTVVDSGQTIAPLSLSLGDHTFVLTALDAAGNQAQKQVVFRVIVTIDSLKAAVSLLTQRGQIEQKASASLMSKLNEASQALARGNRTAARNKLNDFISQVRAQSGKSITPSAAQVLIGDAEYALATL